MRLSWPMLAVCALGSLVAFNAQAQGVEDDDQDAGPATSLVGRLQMVRYGIVSGRIIGVSAQTGTSMTYNLPNQAAGRSERVSIDVTTGSPTVRYELSSREENLTIELVEAEQLTVSRTSKSSRLNSLNFQQPLRGDFVLTVGEGEQRRVLRGASLWHLALADPELCRTDLFPLLEMLRPSWHLSPLVAAIEESLSRWAAAHRVADRRQWLSWVESLGSTQFARRQAAGRNLLDAGPAVLPFLENLDRTQLDAEQRSRVRDLIALLDDYTEDTVDRVAVWLAADPDVWLSLLSRNDESRRRLAAGQLSQLLGAPIEFDPAADQPIRDAQVARLRARLNAGAAPTPR